MAQWTETQVSELKRLLDEGLSYGAIAAAIGGPSRNACIGAARRRGWTQANGHGSRPRRPKSRTPRLVDEHKLETLPRIPVEALMDEPEPPADFEQTKCGVYDLTADVCHWPIGDPGTPGFFFCGAEIDRAPYCAYHAKLGTVPLPTRTYNRRNYAHGSRQAG